jgi:hypothetical protein
MALRTSMSTRTISADPGLLSPEELLKNHKDGRRRTLEEIIAKKHALRENEYFMGSLAQRCRDYVRWFLDNARLKISVSLSY